MTRQELIKQIKSEKKNQFPDEHINKWIDQLESIIEDFLGHKSNDPEELTVTAPYDVIYISWIKAKIDYTNEDYESYGNNQSQFNTDLASFKAYALRNGIVNDNLPKKIKNVW